MRAVETDTLRTWLENGQPVSILDIRTADDRREWSIPGSIHVDAYDRLKRGDPHALDQIALPNDRPIVTICNQGKVSQVAAAQLEERGLEALYLRGGMKSWGLAWNTAEQTIGETEVVQVRRTGKGCLSYIVGSGTEAVVIDVSL